MTKAIELSEDKLKAINLLKEIDTIFSRNGIWYSLSYGTALGAVREKGFIKWDRDIDILIKSNQKREARIALRQHLSKDFKVESCEDDNVTAFDIIVIKGIPEELMHVDLYPLIGVANDDKKGFIFQNYCRYVNKIFGCKYINMNRLQNKWKIPIVYLIRFVEYLVPDRLYRRYISRLSTKWPIESSKYCFPFSNDGKKGEIMPTQLVLDTVRVPFESLYLPVPKDYETYLKRIYGDDYMVPKQY